MRGQIEVMSRGLSVTQGHVTVWHMDGGDTTVMSHGLTVTRGRRGHIPAVSHRHIVT